MYKYKNFMVPLISSLVLSFCFSIYQYSSPEISSASNTNTENNDTEKTFFIASDIHYLSPKLTDNGIAFSNLINNGDGKQLNYIDNIFDSLIYNIKKDSPNFLILSGDLTFNGEKESHINLASKLNQIEKLGTTVYVVPGNHDINNPWSRKFVKDKLIKVANITAKDFSTIYSNFGFKEAISRDTNSLSYLVTPTKSLWLLMLDDNKYSNNSKFNMPDMSGYLSKETLNWIKDCSALAKKNNAKLAVVTHHNLINHSEYVWDGYTLDNSKEVLSVFKDCEITLSFSGHTHLQSIKNYKDDNFSFSDISSASLAVYPQKYGIFKIYNNSLKYSTTKVNVDEWGKYVHISDSNLVNFNSNSREFYKNFVYNQNFKNLLAMDHYSNNEITLMCETLRNIRLKYDSELDTITWEEILSSEGFSLLMNCDSIYMKHYVKLANDRNVEENNKLEVIL